MSQDGIEKASAEVAGQAKEKAAAEVLADFFGATASLERDAERLAGLLRQFAELNVTAAQEEPRIHDRSREVNAICVETGTERFINGDEMTRLLRGLEQSFGERLSDKDFQDMAFAAWQSGSEHSGDVRSFVVGWVTARLRQIASTRMNEARTGSTPRKSVPLPRWGAAAARIVVLGCGAITIASACLDSLQIGLSSTAFCVAGLAYSLMSDRKAKE